MILIACSVFDTAVKAYTPPMFFRSKGEALRSFTDACNDEKSNFFRHAEDYIFMHVGTFDDSTGEITGVIPSKLLHALEAVEPFKPDKMVAGDPTTGNRGLPM